MVTWYKLIFCIHTARMHFSVSCPIFLDRVLHGSTLAWCANMYIFMQASSTLLVTANKLQFLDFREHRGTHQDFIKLHSRKHSRSLQMSELKLCVRKQTFWNFNCCSATLDLTWLGHDTIRQELELEGEEKVSS